MSLNYCKICLKNSNILTNLHEIDVNNVSLLVKLQNIVPELPWNTDNQICENCVLNLENVYNFRRLCIESYNKLLIEHKSKIKDCNNDVNHDISTELLPNIEHSCNICKSLFMNEKVLKNHLTICKNVGNKCGNSTQSFSRQEIVDVYEKSNIVKSDKNEFVCYVCMANFTNNAEFDLHIDTVHSTFDKNGRKRQNNTFICKMCKITFKLKKELIEHCLSIHGMILSEIKPYSCFKCIKTFKSTATFNQHKKYHEGIRSNICSFCGKGFITKSDLVTHEYIHFNKKSYKCSFCQASFNTSKNLNAHLYVVHTESEKWKYECKICLKRFPLKVGYEEHLKRHKGEKQFSCLICQKSFVSKTELKKHTKYHSDVKQFKCNQCKREFKQKINHDIHLFKSHATTCSKMVLKVKKHVCHICPSSFYDKNKLKRHLCSHSGVKPFNCDICDRKFSDKSYLNQHVKNKHK